ncbi:MAG: MgtC/SapB family protein [Candidatus Woesearchaeota archaeon]
MDIATQIDVILKLILAGFLGFVIAWDRKQYGKGAGMRTYGLISMGSCLFTITSIYFMGTADPSRIAANIVTGIGFIGAGIIWQKKDAIVGVTTAAGLWVAAAIGIAVAIDMWVTAVAASLIVMGIFATRRIVPWA